MGPNTDDIMWKSLNKFLSEDDAATTVEYCVMLALILLAVIGGLTATGAGTNGWWQDIGSEMTNYGM